MNLLEAVLEICRKLNIPDDLVQKNLRQCGSPGKASERRQAPDNLEVSRAEEAELSSDTIGAYKVKYLFFFSKRPDFKLQLLFYPYKNLAGETCLMPRFHYFHHQAPVGSKTRDGAKDPESLSDEDDSPKDEDAAPATPTLRAPAKPRSKNKRRYNRSTKPRQ